MTDRRDDLLRQAYAYALEHGLSDLSLRPLAAAIGSSPRVLLFLFGSKDGLVRELLAQARADELALLEQVRGGSLAEVAEAVWAWLAAPEHRALLTLWLEGYGRSLVAPDGPWAGFARATVEDWLAVLADAQPTPHATSTSTSTDTATSNGNGPDAKPDTEAGPTAPKVERTFVLPDLPSAEVERTFFLPGAAVDRTFVLADAGAEVERTFVLAVLRGALLDLLATGDVERTTAAVTSMTRSIR